MSAPSKSSPCVSIGLPVYNGENYLAEAIESLLSQSLTDFELIISDNASTDATQSICEKYQKQDPRIRYTRTDQNLGAAQNYNRIVPLAQGRYFKWAAHDDNCYPDFLSGCVTTLDAHQDAVLCYPSTHVIDGAGKVLREYRDGLGVAQASSHERLLAYLRANFMRRKGMCNPIFGVMRTAALRKTRMIQKFVASDRLLLAHFALLGKSIELPDILFQRRVHADDSTMANWNFTDRMEWFSSGTSRKRSFRFPTRFNNHFGVRATHIRDLFRAISELVEDEAERRMCRRELTRLLLTDPKWIYIDLKYSLGFVPRGKVIIENLANG